MNSTGALDNENRRMFLKDFPRQLLKGVRSIATTLSLSATKMADPSSGGREAEDSVGADPRVRPHQDGQAQWPAPTSQIARLDVARCLAWGGASCQLCYLACPLRDQAIEMCDQKPVIIPSHCDGCAMCVVACETVNVPPAIQMVPPPVSSAEGGSHSASRYKTGGGMVFSQMKPKLTAAKATASSRGLDAVPARGDMPRAGGGEAKRSRPLTEQE